ncbi:hypothetical protein P280DRAFT_467880 [Massarina eburnea CBS 473.64]|uniref:PHD-type domain-containing protein n=1 Tax=Massarina eburnea CBS 473.64 TaxID=1395130 RepID=A0A6A6S5T5_9PLEO|nr:hypothetical protein P280DRAFT_467880 [Massarina eburnea CBS 473.64]
MPPAVSSRTGGAVTASDRRQSTRQGRTTVRPTNYYARTFAGRLAANGLEQTPEASNPPGFCPALTHFTQAVDAFPKELIKHFSTFKEVEAKMHDPEHVLRALLAEIAQMPVPTRAQRHEATPNGTGGDISASASINGSIPQDPAARYKQLFPDDFDSLPSDEQADLTKRQTFFRLRMLIGNMLPILDEKLVVLSATKATKDKGIARMNSSYTHLDDEISEEARYGSLTHWAYADKEEKKKGGQSHERQRREVVSANNLAAAAQHVHDVDSIAAKSEARREAMLAKRNRNQHIDSDFDDRPTKKTQKRKAIVADVAGNDARNIGLGITNGAPPQGKRKKTEKALAAAAAAAAAPAMERSLSGALKAAGPGGRSGISPRATPAAEGNGPGKRKPRAAPVPAQRKHALPTYSPPPASSPLASTFSLPKAVIANTERPLATRGRKNSTANSVASAAPEHTAAPRPASSHSIPQAINSNVITELEHAAGISRDNNTSVKGASTPKETTELPPFESLPATSLKHEEVEAQEPESMEVETPAPAPATTRTGRASKTATPIIGSFPDIPMARSRSTRKANAGNGNSNTSSENNSTMTGTVSKRGHNKIAPATSNVVGQSPALESAPEFKSNVQSRASSVAPEQEGQDAESEEDGDEPLYCYCNQVSFGQMIACDYDSCPREWFHLPCVNLERAPSGRSKWFCSKDCEEAHAKGKKSKGGRPGSSRQ